MSQSCRSRHWLYPAVALSFVLVAATPAAEPGLVYDFTMTVTSTTDGKSREVQRMVGRGQVAGDRARVDLTEVKAATPMTEKGMYVIVDGGGQRMVMVNPKEKAYFAFDPEEMAKGVGAAMRSAGPIMQMSMSDAKVEVQEIGAGPTLHGYDTRHFRLVQSYRMTMRVMGRGSTTTANDTIDYYIAPKLRRELNPFARMAGSAGMIDFDNPEYARQLRAANEKLSVGLPLRTEMRGTIVDERGTVTTNRSVMEVTSIRQGDVPSSAFEIPAGYTERPSPFAAMAAKGAPEGGAPGAARPAADSSAAPKPDAKDAAKRALRGVLRRP